MTEAPFRVLSLNEVEQLSLKATRGAGAAWGVAEDAARAARWLAAHGIGWAPPLLDLLGTEPPARGLLAALAVADRLARAAPGDGWTVGNGAPGWLLPALASARPSLALVLAWPAGRAVLRPDGAVETDAPQDALALFTPAPVRVEVRADAPALAHVWRAGTRRGPVEADSLARVEALALRTAVPASAQSRAAGAGGGRVDDD